MQTKQQMLASARAQHTYKKLQQQGTPAVICRGASGDDFNFFYSVFSYWSDHCLGWVAEARNRPPICPYCRLITAPKHEFDIDVTPYDARKESRNRDSTPRQASEPDSASRSKLSKVSDSSKHRSTGDKSDAKTKNKKVSKTKLSKKAKRPKK
jgi:hypothetical protein